MTRTEKFFWNSFSSAVLQIVTMITGMITPRVMLTVYGSDINGLITSIGQFISYFSLVEAGLAAATIYALYAPLANDDHDKINSIVTASKQFYIQSGFIFVALTAGLAALYPVFVKSDILSRPEICILVLILGISGAMEFFTLAKYRAILTADQKTYIIALTSSLIIILNTLIILISAKLKLNVIIMRALVLMTVFLRSLILSLYVKKKYKYIRFNATPDKTALNKRWDALYQQLLGSAQNGAPVVLITFLSTLKQVSIYSIYSMVLSGLNGILGIFMSGLAASFGEIIAKKEQTTLQKTYSDFEYAYYMLITIVYTVCFITIMPFIKIYTASVTDANYNLAIYGFLFTLNGLLYNIKTPQGMIVISAGLYKETRWRSTTQALLIVIPGIVLTHFFGVAGMMAALCLSNIYRTIDLLFFIPKYVTKLSPLQTARRMLRIAVCICVSAGSAHFLSYAPRSLLSWFLYAAVIGIYVTVIVLIINFAFERKAFANICLRAKGMVVNRIGKACR